MSVATSTAIIIGAAAVGAQAAGNIYAAHTQGSAAREGLDAQTAASREALAYEKEQDRIERERTDRLDKLKEESDAFERARLQRRTETEANRYGDFTNNIAPYLSTGASANQQIASLFGFPAPAPYVPRPTQGPGGGTPFVPPTPLPIVPPTTPPVSTTQPVPSPAPTGEQTVMMLAPDGTRKAVPQSQVQHYISQGAKVVA